MIDAWIVIRKTLLETLWQQSHPELDSAGFPLTPIPDNALMLASGAVRGFWKDITDSAIVYETVNVIKSADDIEEFNTTHAADILAIYGWSQGSGLDNDIPENGYPTVPQGVLDVMKDHIIEDEPPIPPTFDNPNWGHVFVGQKQRVFAGEFSLEFSEEFF